jgi:hypothetical protein
MVLDIQRVDKGASFAVILVEKCVAMWKVI